MRALYRGHAAGMERRVTIALTRQLSLAVDVRVRRVAARSIDSVLHKCWPPFTRSFHTAARTAMGASMGDAHAVAALIAAEPDDMVRQRLARLAHWPPRCAAGPPYAPGSPVRQKYPPLLLL